MYKWQCGATKRAPGGHPTKTGVAAVALVLVKQHSDQLFQAGISHVQCIFTALVALAYFKLMPGLKIIKRLFCHHRVQTLARLTILWHS